MFRSLSVTATFALIFYACGGPPSLTILEGNTMGTTFQIKYVASDGLKNPTVLKAGVDSVLSEVNRQMSTYIHDSEISWFNRSESNEPISVSKEFYYVVNRALYWSCLLYTSPSPRDRG